MKNKQGQNLELKIAELEKELAAKNRDVEIEASLARVRARTMAMRYSDELAETAYILFQQFRELGENPDQATIGIINEAEGVIEYWVTIHGGQTNRVFKFPVDEPNVTGKIYKAWKAQHKSLVMDLSGKALRDFSKFRESMGGAGYNSEEKRRIINVAFFSKGLINVQSTVERSAESLRLLERFANVFEGTFTRFLDLKKAEAQAREAQIELALERVRAKTMAMQHSNELLETSEVVFQQLRDLGETADQIGIAIVKEDDGVFDLFATLYGTQMVRVFQPKIDDHFVMGRVYKNWKALKKSFVVELGGEELRQYNILRNQLGGQNYYNENIGPDDRWIVSCASFSRGVLSFSSSTEPTMEAALLLERFAKVFDSTYTRFLDLQKAEEQARESKIETALERVRSRTMGMQHSEELREVIQVVFEQLKQLNFNVDSANFALDYKESDDFNLWLSSTGHLYPTKVHIPYIDIPIFNHFIEAKKNKVDFVTENYSFEEKNAFFDHFFKNVPMVANERKEFVMGTAGYARSTVLMKNVTLSMQNYAAIPYSEEENAALRRFGKVFEQTYTRFLDLQKAEEQAREAQIELGLERVRARAMAMQNSGEINDLIGAVFYELTKLDLVITRCRLWIIDPASLSCMNWQANQETPAYPLGSFIKYNEQPFYLAILKAWKERSLKLVYELKGGEKKSWDDFLFNETEFSRLPEVVKEGMRAPERVLLSASFGNFGAMQTGSLDPLSDKQMEILSRFVKVFDMSYTRFNDLKQAEAQARESQIQLALERIRARTMAMQKSDELAETAMTLFQQFNKLGVKPERIFIGNMDENARTIEFWGTDQGGNQMNPRFEVNADATIGFSQIYKAWKTKKKTHTVIMKGKELADHVRYVQDVLHMPMQPELVQQQRIMYSAFFSKGLFMIVTPEIQSNETIGILERFAGVFDGTYTRFLDLQKAEGQAREAQIEVALEKVRGKAMAMHNSKDLSSAVSLVFTELKKLGIRPIRCGVGFMTKNPPRTLLYTATISNDNDTLDLVGWVDSAGHPVLEKIYDSWLKQENYFPVLNGKELKAYYKKLAHGLHFPSIHDGTSDEKQYGHFLPFPEGMLNAWAERPYSEPELKILDRFRSIISLTFRRYLDLKKAEEAAREAIKRASLDRVRAEIASMRSVADLDRITPLIWNELTILGVPFIRCGVFIMDEAQQVIHTYLSTPDGKAIAAFQLRFSNDSGNGVNGAALRGWREKQMVTLHWTEEEFRNFSHSLKEQGEIISEESYLTERPPTGLDLHFFPFLQGMLYAGNSAPLSDDDKDLVQSLADAFSTAYARYEDFSRLELAKQEVERTLTDLKAAQTRLIQSEKMASLGELTAGIAHEIQNPLNFVNNFSEVNKEMLEELKDESKKPKAERDEQLEIDLINDLIQNEEKINHHGKRADSIVKGMLQHSRTSSAQKELTDINALADEYLRLSYHGLRAKDKNFNAEMATNFDIMLPKVKVVPQDMGRVLLNLFNNAFYAVNQKKKTAGTDYKPTIEVTTFAPPSGGWGVKVRDNGIGIPDSIKEKIMQPFFTTKPTGEGTGLGLSLTYDMVVKGHGGKLEIDSKEGEYSIFTVSLPAD